jgi:predicted outer membrane repeat protein/parallel beta-helix repeat protein
MAMFLMAMGCTAAEGRTIYVDDDGPADFSNIQAAINDANDGDTVIVADGVYTGSGNRDIDFNGKAITVRSENGPGNCIIDCQLLGNGFHLHSGEDNDSILDGFTITQSSPGGMGIWCEDWSNPIITNCIITRTSHGIYVNKNTSKITNCVAANNSGSGIVCFDSSPTITNCTVINNGWPGIKCYWGSTPTITNSILRGNSSPQIDDSGSSIATVTYSNVQGGRAGEGNINADPCFVSSSYYRLMPNSSCIDAGTNIPVGGLPETDIEGYPRFSDGDNDGVDVADMGAYESWPLSEPIIWLSDWKLEFIANEGGPNPPEQILTIHNSGAGTINWTISHNCQWLEVDPDAGSSTGQPNDVVLSVDVNGLPIGEYNCVLTISDPNAINTPLRVIVNLYVGTPLIGVAPTEVYFLYTVGAPSPEPQTISIWNDAVGRLDWQIIEDCNWLQVDPNAGSSTMQANEVTLSVDVSGLAPDMYNCQLTITAEGAVNSPQIIQVNLHVTHGELHVPSQYPTIQTAINASVGGNEIIVSAGTYYENIDFGGKNIILRSTDPPDPSVVANTIIDGSQSGSVVTFAGSESASCVLSGFTITNGGGTYGCGGGIYGNGTLATIQYNVVSGNNAEPYGWPSGGYGGGLYDCDGMIQYNEISWNQAIANEGSTNGGGLYGCDGTIRNNIISYNSFGGLAWGGDGGGMYCKYGSATVTNCTFSNNSAPDFGGGIYSEGGSLTITNCTFNRNSVEYYGAGICSVGVGVSSILTNCIFIGNSAGAGGGMLNGGNATLTNCTFTGNSAGEGGGMWNYGIATLTNCILWGNTASRGLQAELGESSALNISFSCIESGQAGIYDPYQGLVWGAGNIDVAPCFADPCNADYHLQSEAGRWDPNQNDWVYDTNTSPCIDAGNPGCPLVDEPNDANNIRINMGAYGGTAEASKSPENWALLADLTNDRIVDFNDLAAFVNYWLDTGECIPSDLDRNQSVDFADFALMALHWLEDNNTAKQHCIVEDNVQYCIRTDKSVYHSGETVEIFYRVTNLGSIPVSLGWVPMPPFCYHFVIVDNNGEHVWQWSWVMPPSPPVEFSLDAYESKEYEINWEMINDNGTAGTEDDFAIGPGMYNITGELHTSPEEDRVRVSVHVSVSE